MARLALLFLFVWLPCAGWAQVNLVPNPSFEEFINCPDNGGQISFAKFWSDPTLQGSTDYLNSCGTGGWETPDAIYGPIIPRTGSSCAAIVTYPGSEFLQVKLSQPLITNKSYHLSFFVSLADSSMHSTNNIGAYLCPTEIFNLDLTQLIPFSPQIENPVGNNLTNTGIWFEISDTIVASGDELYLILGNFDSEENTIFFERIGANWCPWAIYYIDDVSIYEITDYNTNDTQIVESISIPNVITPNHDGLNDHLAPQTDLPYHLVIYNRWGQPIFTGENQPWKPSADIIDGVYFYVLTCRLPNGESTTRTGTVSVLR